MINCYLLSLRWHNYSLEDKCQPYQTHILRVHSSLSNSLSKCLYIFKNFLLSNKLRSCCLQKNLKEQVIQQDQRKVMSGKRSYPQIRVRIHNIWKLIVASSTQIMDFPNKGLSSTFWFRTKKSEKYKISYIRIVIIIHLYIKYLVAVTSAVSGRLTSCESSRI